MRSRFLLFPAALMACAAAHATDYMTVEEGQALLFPGANFTPHDVILRQNQMDALLKVADGSVPSWSVTAWEVSTGGWVFLDQVPGRDDAIHYLIGINPDGSVKGVEILECLPGYDTVRDPKWLAQFAGLEPDQDDLAGHIEIISGASLSSEHIAKGVRRIMITYGMFFAPQAEQKDSQRG